MENNVILPPVKKQKKPVFLILLIVLLLGAIAVMTVMYYNLKIDSTEQENYLNEEKDRLSEQLKEMYFAYDSLKTENDTMNIKLDAEKVKIERLLKIKASNIATIKTYEKELQTLRKIMRSYIVQIDSLNQMNQVLSEENIRVRSELKQVESHKQQLIQEKDQLSSVVEKASVLSAKDLIVTPMNEKGRDQTKVTKVDKIKTCFTLRENPIVPAGAKRIFIRIIDPNGIILTHDPSNIISATNEQQLVFSESREVDYENQDIDVCIFWSKKDDLFPGKYIVELYAEGNKIGQGEFLLKK